MGTFVVAYGLSGTTGFYTPVTEAGLVVPEPSSLVLIGFGLLGLARISRKLKK